MTALYLLNKNQEVFHIIPDQDILELWDTDGINTLDTVEGSIRTTKELQAHLTNAYYYAIPEPNTNNLFSIYKHLSMETTNRSINIFGLQLGLDELKSMGYIKDYRPQNRTITEVVNTILADTGWEIGFIDTRIPNITSTFYYLNKLDALSQLIELTGCEVDFKVSITGKRISMKYINIYIKMGENTGKRFVYGTNALEIVKEYDTAELYTAILGRGRGEETENGGFGRKINFKDVVWKKSAGKPLDKPLDQEYLEMPEATSQFGYPNGQPRILLKDYEDIEDKNELIQATYEDLKIVSRPKVQFKSTVVNTGDLKKGDTVTIVRHDLDIKYQTRVFKVKRNRKNNLLTQIELGDVIVDSPAKKQADFTKNLTNRVEQIVNQLNNVSVIAGDGTKVNYGPDQPLTAKVGDLWYEQLLNGKTNLRKWNGTEWGIIVNDLTGEEIRAEVSAVIADMVVEKERINQTITKADKAITDAGFAKLDATEAKASSLDAVNTANTAKDNSEKALTNSQNSLTNSDEALVKAGQALGKASATEVTTASLITSYDALTKTVGLKAEKEELNVVNGIITQHGLDISANATAVGLKADKTLVNTIKGTVDKHTLDIKAGADGLLLKADSSLVNTLKGTVDSQGLAITAAANGLTLKADTTVVNAIKGTVDTHTNQIKVVSDGLALKAESSLVDTIKGTVATHTNQISANSQAITARLTSAQVDSLVTAKGYATTTALNATSSSLSASIVEVSTDLKNLEIGGRNYLQSDKWTSYNEYNSTPIQSKDVVSWTKNNATNYIAIGQSYTIPFGVGIVYTLSGYMKRNGLALKNTDWLYKGASTNQGKVESFKVVDDTGYFEITQNWTGNSPWVFHGGMFSGTIGDKFTVNNFMMSKGNKATDWSPAPEDMATVERAVQIEANLNGLQTTVKNKAEQSQVTQLAGQISTKVENATYSSKMTQLDNAINLRVSKANIVTEINLSAETSTVRIAGKRIQLDGDVAMDNAFVNRIKAIEVIADKITTGTLNASNLKVIGLDAGSITSGTLNSINITGTKITNNFSISSEGATLNGATVIAGDYRMDYTVKETGQKGKMVINPISLYSQIFTSSGSLLSRWEISSAGLQVSNSGLTAFYTQDGIYFQAGGEASVNYRASNARIEIGSYNGVDLGTKVNGRYESKFAVGGGKDGIASFVDAYAPFTARYGIDVYSQELKNAITISGTNNILFRGSSNRIVQGSDGFLNILSPMQLSLGWTNGTSSFTTMIITQNQVVAKKNLNMDGNQMVGVSDSRLKNAIDPTVIDSLSAISRWKFVDFNWRHDDKPKGRQFGLIAQDTPELALYDAKNDEYTISASKQIMMTSHGLSQLNNKVIGITALIHSSNATANLALSEVQMLKQEVQNLRQKIDKLESVA